jgi:BlaI family transcriptional regulator, penicillinase repressor
MGNRSQDVSEAELAVLHVLWDRGPSTIRQLTSVLYPEGTVSQYATVQKLLERLEAKECVNRDRSAAVHVFFPQIERETLVGRRLQAVAESLCDGAYGPLLTHLVRAQRLSPEDRQALRDMIERLDQENHLNSQSPKQN